MKMRQSKSFALAVLMVLIAMVMTACMPETPEQIVTSFVAAV
jgi:hypothetical protein